MLGILCGLLVAVLPVVGQSPYQLGKRDAAVLALGGAMSLAGHIQDLRTEAPPFPNLNPESIPAFDRFAIHNWSEPAQKASDGMVLISGMGAASLLLHKPVRSSLLPILVMGAESMLLSDGLVALSKPLVLRPRPYLYGSLAPQSAREKHDAHFSFFSGHTTYSATLCFFTAKVIHDLHPDSRWRKWVWVGAAVVPAATGALRVMGGKHFLSDVITGYAVGAASGILIPHLHMQSGWLKASSKWKPSIYATGGQLGAIWTF